MKATVVLQRRRCANFLDIHEPNFPQEKLEASEALIQLIYGAGFHFLDAMMMHWKINDLMQFH